MLYKWNHTGDLGFAFFTQHNSLDIHLDGLSHVSVVCPSLLTSSYSSVWKYNGLTFHVLKDICVASNLGLLQIKLL